MMVSSRYSFNISKVLLSLSIILSFYLIHKCEISLKSQHIFIPSSRHSYSLRKLRLPKPVWITSTVSHASKSASTRHVRIFCVGWAARAKVSTRGSSSTTAPNGSGQCSSSWNDENWSRFRINWTTLPTVNFLFSIPNAIANILLKQEWRVKKLFIEDIIET